MKIASVAKPEINKRYYRAISGKVILGFATEDQREKFLAMNNSWKWSRYVDHLPLNSAGDGWWQPIEDFQAREDIFNAAIYAAKIWSIRAH